MGNVLSAGIGQAPARQAALKAKVPDTVPCTTVSKVCGSGLQAVVFGARAVMLGDADLVVAGGMESMSNVPYYLTKARTGYRMGDDKIVDGMIYDGLWDPYKDYHMGQAGELCAREYGLTREAQDAFARESYTRALSAQRDGLFDPEIAPVEIAQKKGEKTRYRPTKSPVVVTSTSSRSSGRPSRRRKRSPRRTPRASTTARRRWPWRANGRSKSESSRRSRESSDSRRPRRLGVVHHGAGQGHRRHHEEARHENLGHRSMGDQRSILLRCHGLFEARRARSGEGQRAWRCGRPRAPHRRVGGAHSDDAALRDEGSRGSPGPRDALHRRRRSRRDGRRTVERSSIGVHLRKLRPPERASGRSFLRHCTSVTSALVFRVGRATPSRSFRLSTFLGQSRISAYRPAHAASVRPPAVLADRARRGARCARGAARRVCEPPPASDCTNRPEYARRVSRSSRRQRAEQRHACGPSRRGGERPRSARRAARRRRKRRCVARRDGVSGFLQSAAASTELGRLAARSGRSGPRAAPRLLPCGRSAPAGRLPRHAARLRAHGLRSRTPVPLRRSERHAGGRVAHVRDDQHGAAAARAERRSVGEARAIRTKPGQRSRQGALHRRRRRVR